MTVISCWCRSAATGSGPCRGAGATSATRRRAPWCARWCEETGLECRAVQLLALFDKLKHPHPPQLPHAHKAFFLCEVTGGSLLTRTDDPRGAAYFPIDALPELPATGLWSPSCAACTTMCGRGGAAPCLTDTPGTLSPVARRPYDQAHRQHPHPGETQGQLSLRRRGAGAQPAGWRGGSPPL